MQRPSVNTYLVGHSNEVDSCIEGIQTAAVLDTGASISTVNDIKFIKSANFAN